MRRDEPDRHGRAADALIASYVRELLADDETQPPHAADPHAEPPTEAPSLAPSADGFAAEATL
jgi:hypothetical protein